MAETIHDDDPCRAKSVGPLDESLHHDGVDFQNAVHRKRVDFPQKGVGGMGALELCGDPGLHGHAVEAPLGLYGRRDVLQLDVLFRHPLLVQEHQSPSHVKMKPSSGTCHSRM